MDKKKAKKSLGQHWLCSGAARDLIVAAAKLTSKDIVVEVGPGTGFLTEALLRTGARVIAVEKDRRLINPLGEKFERFIKPRKLEIIQNDILQFKPPEKPYKIVANIPYYITGQFLRYFLTQPRQPQLMVLMLQKEVAERIVTRSTGRRRKEGLLSISVKVFGEPKYLKTVPAGAFSPRPKVDSAILLIENIGRERLAEVDEELFFKTLKRGFSHKRKLLKSNLNISTETLSRCGIDEKARAENLTLADWLCLAKKGG